MRCNSLSLADLLLSLVNSCFALVVVLPLGCQRAGGELGPKLDVPQSVVRLGEIPVALNSRVVTFTLTNVGSGLLRLSRVETSCTCSKASVSKSTIAEGESAELTVEIDIKESGERHAAVTIDTNATNAVRVSLEVYWSGVLPVVISTPVENLGNLPPGETVDKVIEAVLSAEAVGVSRVSSNDVSVALGAKSVRDRVLRIPVRLSTGEHFGDGSATVTLHLDNGWPSAVEKRYHWKVVPSVSAAPARLSLGGTSPGQTIAGRVVLVQYYGGPLSVRSVEWVEPLAGTADIHIKSELRPPAIELVWTAPELPGVHRGILRVHFESTLLAPIDIPVSGFSLAKD